MKNNDVLVELFVDQYFKIESQIIHIAIILHTNIQLKKVDII